MPAEHSVTAGVIAETVKSTVKTQAAKKMVEPPVHQLPITADSIADFFSHIMDFSKCCFYDFMNAISNLFYNIGLYFYSIVYVTMETWFIYGPRWIPGFYGNAGLPENDICGKMIGTKSELFEGGSGAATCRQYIHQIVTERSSLTCLIILILYVQYGLWPTIDLLHSLWNYKEFERVRKKREEANEKSARTKKRNQVMETSLVFLSGVVCVDSENIGQVIFQLRTIREYLDKIDDEDLLKMIQWEVKDDWKSDRINVAHASLGNGSRSTSNGSTY